MILHYSSNSSLGSTIMEVTTQNTMTPTITVDEQNFHKVSLGQTAEITVDALKGETFIATVIRISSKGVSNGGSSKFSVELTLDRTGNMLDGMSATATITLATTSDILTVPLAALGEQGSKTIIYTGYDEDSGELINPAEVTIGITDAENVQILDGLDAGATYYYSYTTILWNCLRLCLIDNRAKGAVKKDPFYRRASKRCTEYSFSYIYCSAARKRTFALHTKFALTC